MGRRKIEIQPILNERNRSVTFLKRKNGLFKKAYELGVLCNVDVAVIIFAEERQGHHVKLYQYCSSDIHDVVGRQIKHEGERDTKGPADFSGGSGGKGAGDDVGDGEDDEGDDDDEPPARSGSKRSRNESSNSGSRLKLPSDMSEDYLPRHNLPTLQHPPSALSLQGSSSSSGGGLPISTVRTSSGSSIGPPSSSSSAYNPGPSNPKGRHHRPSNASRSPPETHTPVGSGYSYHGHGHAPPSSFRGGYGASGGGGAPGGAGGGGNFPNYFPNQTPPGGYLPLPGSNDYPRGGGPGGGSGGGARRGFGAPFADGVGGGGGMYAGGHGHGHGSLHPRSRSGDGGGGSNESNVFDFLGDANPRQGSNSNPSNFGLEWPVGSGSGAAGAPSGGPPPQPQPSNNANSGAGGGGDWFELLSSAPNPNAPGRDTKLSWERGGGSSGLGGPGAGGGSGLPPGGPVGSNDRHGAPPGGRGLYTNGGGSRGSISHSMSHSPVMSPSTTAGSLGSGSMDMSIGMSRSGHGGMDVGMGMNVNMAGVSRDGVGGGGMKVERRD